jgi:hypothetical protein
MAVREVIHFPFWAQLAEAVARDEWRVASGTEHARNIAPKHSSYQSTSLHRLMMPARILPEPVAKSP